MAALEAEHFLTAHEGLDDRTAERATAEDDAETARVAAASETAPGGTEAVALANGAHTRDKFAQA